MRFQNHVKKNSKNAIALCDQLAPPSVENAMLYRLRTFKLPAVPCMIARVTCNWLGQCLSA
jgi:hypothetical protein